MDKAQARKVVDSVSAEARAVIDSAVGQGLTRSQGVDILSMVVSSEREFDELSEEASKNPTGSDVHDGAFAALGGQQPNPKS